MSPSGRRFLGVVATAFIVRAVYLVGVGPDPNFALTPDSPSYLNPARALAVHGTFSDTPSPPFAYGTERTPGYPLFLSFFSHREPPAVRSAVWTQAVLGALTAGLLYVTAVLLWGNGVAPLVAGLGLALDFVIVLHTGFVLTETVFLFLFTLTLYALVRFRVCQRPEWAIAAGVLSGAATLVRPVTLYFPLFIMPFLAWEARRQGRRGWGRVFLFLLAAMALPAAWTYRNWAKTGVATFSSIQGNNLYIVRAALVEMNRTGKPYEEAMSNLESEYRRSVSNSLSAEEELVQKGAWAFRHLKRYPLDYARVVARDAVKLLVGNSFKAAAWTLGKDERYDPARIPLHPSQGLWEQARDVIVRHPLLGIGMAFYLSVLACSYMLAMVGFVGTWRGEGPAKALFVVSSVVYIALVTVGSAAQARYRIPAMPAIFLLAGQGAHLLFGRKTP